ncbi:MULTISPECIES: RHS repeat domain-containing protein [unclassified Chryseobacterium]|uniref:RHS repeat domain-containing protein n=1 Tax=unclassified Chryseobacterium TaxID=2593645 RepID=UPI00100A5098|nr:MULTISPECIES: RHS repeat-associated core domain-containing protein [unclassified Chryseobacterium]RXM50627.1 hypothetical protein BOQ64_17965 [Chryseobacterium sp. CH25]RXM63261.1 hypothetical protein BOQ60_18160 [Chryseobacterium sp. CH1]
MVVFHLDLKNRYIYQYKDHLGNTRVSFAKNSAGVLEVTDTNNYYPFGLNHISEFKGLLGGYLNYKYNGKELQETGMYDYGARFYMPDIGRFGVHDPLSASTLDSYGYAFNNPILFIDPDGRSPEEVDFDKKQDNKNEFSNKRGDNKISTAFVNERNGKTVIVNDGLDDVFM